jgi:hypothetical protein
MMGPTNYYSNMWLHDTITKVLSQNVDEILTYFVHFLLSIHLWMITELHGDNNYKYNFYFNALI